MSDDHPVTPVEAAFAYHGGRMDLAQSRFRDAPMPWVDLSTGINPLGWPIERIGALDHGALPSPDAVHALCEAAKRCFGGDAWSIAAVPGSEMGLRLLAHVDLPRPWRVVVPTYRTHLDVLPGAEPIAVERLADEAIRGGTILLANPNNPDGRIVAPAVLIDIARRLAARGGMLVVDEAFADAVPGASVLPLLETEDRLIVTRSFGKFFGLAGVRLGFVCGLAETVGKIAAVLGSWPVSTLALACGTAAYGDDAWIADTRGRLQDDAAALDAMVRSRGWDVRGDCPLFRLMTGSGAGAVFGHLAAAGILTRPFDDAPDWLRIGLPADAAAFARLREALPYR